MHPVDPSVCDWNWMLIFAFCFKNMNILARKWWSAHMLQDVWRQCQNLDCSSAYRIHSAMHNSSGCLATMKPRCGSAYWKDTAMHSAANAPGCFAMMKSRCSSAHWKDPAMQNTSKTWACLKRCVNSQLTLLSKLRIFYWAYKGTHLFQNILTECSIFGGWVGGWETLSHWVPGPESY